MDSTTPDPPIPPTPPQTPPRISFIPPLYLQRRTAVHSILRTLSSTTPRFAGTLRSLLDVGCGADCLFLRSMIPCEDRLPIERLTGIDIDDDLWSSWCKGSISPGSFGGSGGKEDRWRPLDVSLLHGSFTHLTPDLVPRHDVIVSTEVIEHLDPEPLEQFAPVLLGEMRPRVCVITTPNRDFNRVFELPFTPLEHSPGEFGRTNLAGATDSLNGLVGVLEALAGGDCGGGGGGGGGNGMDCSRSEDDENRFWRVGVPYPMRHHDHRFEWSREEFRRWARKAAEEFGYEVSFTGVGGLERGMRVRGGTGWAVEKALRDAMADVESDHLDDWEGRYGDDGDEKDIYTAELVGDLAERAKVVFGHCSQIAVFTVKEEFDEPISGEGEGVDWQSLITPDNWFELPSFSVSNVRLVCHERYPYEEQEEFPPGFVTVLELVEKVLIQFLPQPVLERWTAGDECAWETTGRRSPIVELINEDDDPAEERRLEKQAQAESKRYMHELMQGMSPEDIAQVVVAVDFKKLFEASWRLQRCCRFHFEVFEEVLARGASLYPALDGGGGGEGWVKVIDTTTSVESTTAPRLIVSTNTATTKVTFNPPQPPPPPAEIVYATYDAPDFTLQGQEDYWNAWDEDRSSGSVNSADKPWADEGEGVIKLYVEATWGAEATAEVGEGDASIVLRLGRNGGILGKDAEQGQEDGGAGGVVVLRFRQW